MASAEAQNCLAVLKVEAAKGDIRRFQLQLPFTFAQVEDLVCTAFGAGWSMKYKDEDGDLCTLVASTFADFISGSGDNGAQTTYRISLHHSLPATPLCQAQSALMAVRAITSFIVLEKDPTTWHAKLKSAVDFNAALAKSITESCGYAVQTLRLIANPFGEYLDTSSSEAALKGVADLKALLDALEKEAGTRIRFSIGAAASAQELQLVPDLIKDGGDLANCCVNVRQDEWGVVDLATVSAAAEACAKLGQTTPNGEGNFNFTINFNGPNLCPYFPAGFNTRENGESFVIGLEYPNLLVSVLKDLTKGKPSVVTSSSARGEEWRMAATTMQAAIEAHMSQIIPLAQAAGKEYGRKFSGVDSSPAPSKSAESMVEVFKLMGVPYFGASGTVEVCQILTRVFKSVRGAPLVGFSGLMLPCLEDLGLAASAEAGQFDIRALMTYSAVCGIGLDTVPVPGDTSAEKMAAIACDCGTMAFRLNKPLTVRLFPAPGLKAGEVTKFPPDSPDLCNCAVLAVP